MLKLFFIVVLAGMFGNLGNYALAQEIAGSEAQVAEVNQKAAFPGGADSMMRYFSLNLRYPSRAMEQKLEGEVMIGFEIDEQGYIHRAIVLNGIGAGCDEEALRVVNGMPRWLPAIQEGKPVKVMFRLPIYFQLPDKQESEE